MPTTVKVQEEDMQKMNEALTAIREKNEKLGTEAAATKEVIDKAGKDIIEIKGKTDRLEAEAKAQSEAMQKLSGTIDVINDNLVVIQKGYAAGSVNSSGYQAHNEYWGALKDSLRSNNNYVLKEQYDAVIEEYIKCYASFSSPEAQEKMKAAAFIGNNPHSGYVVPVELLSKIFKKRYETSPLRNYASVISISTESAKVMLDDEDLEISEIGEADKRGESSMPGMGFVEISTNELWAKVPISLQLLEDAVFNLQDWLQDKVTKKFSRQENTQFVRGSGVKQAQGFLSYPAWAQNGKQYYYRNAVEQVETQGSGKVGGDDVIRLLGDLKSEYLQNAAWAMNSTTFYKNILTLKASDGHYLVNPAMLAQGADLLLMGKKVAFFDDMPGVAANSLAICLADWGEFYTILDRIGMWTQADPYSSDGFLKIKNRIRVGGAVANYEAGKLMKIKA